MLWVLVLTVVTMIPSEWEPIGVNSKIIDVYQDFNQCAADREQIIYETLGSVNGFPPPNTQLVCIRLEQVEAGQKRENSK